MTAIPPLVTSGTPTVLTYLPIIVWIILHPATRQSRTSRGSWSWVGRLSLRVRALLWLTRALRAVAMDRYLVSLMSLTLSNHRRYKFSRILQMKIHLPFIIKIGSKSSPFPVSYPKDSISIRESYNISFDSLYNSAFFTYVARLLTLSQKTTIQFLCICIFIPKITDFIVISLP